MTLNKTSPENFIWQDETKRATGQIWILGKDQLSYQAVHLWANLYAQLTKRCIKRPEYQIVTGADYYCKVVS